MLLSVCLKDRTSYMLRLFKDFWTSCTTECQICLEIINENGIVGMPDTGLLNLEKMFHVQCIERWRRERTRDPFNRVIRYYFPFPPRTLDECEIMLNEIKGFIGEHDIDRVYREVYRRVNTEEVLDIELNFKKYIKSC
ncbi:U-box/RING-like domain protein [Parapoynx stagnalis nucleopolyhedrovirus]|uniref:U-box/RING-like domain protein n=1 Tax=Parapoynx stagnalis nucleopolyhedrovirus TaxID=2993413 RepID=A0A9E8C0H3_9ABAC|nr:U-box/RING-like domain protein [Parapoynx stagnalis nucleopolyhedrovirus]